MSDLSALEIAVCNVIDEALEPLDAAARVEALRGLICALEVRWEAEIHPERFGCEHASEHLTS